MSYKEINTKGASTKDAHRTLEFEDNIVPADEQEPEVGASKVEVETEVAEKPSKSEKPHKSRAQERIKTLVAREKEALMRAEQAEQRAAELEKKYVASTTATKTTLKEQLEETIKSLHAQTIQAMQSGDNETAVVLQDKLITAKMELRSLDSELKQAKEAPQPVIRPPQPQISDKAAEWIATYPEFHTDELFHNFAILVNNQLLREGFDPNTDEFYEELSQRSAKRFPEVFGVQQENSVLLNQDSDSPEAEGVKPAPVQKTQKARTSEQVVSGSSRPSTNVIQKKNSTQVHLTDQDIRQAEAWGLDLNRMARRIAHRENNTRTDGYVPINIPKN